MNSVWQAVPGLLEVVELPGQSRLFHVLESDDIILANSEDAEWFRLLRRWDWRRYQTLAAQYYEALYRFNLCAAQRRETSEDEPADGHGESKEDARERLLFQRPTMGNSGAALLYEPAQAPAVVQIDPGEIEPGKVPSRLAGKQPKCFFALFKAFLGVNLMGHACEPEVVHRELTNNPPFARACGFSPPDRYGRYDQSAIPSLRKLEQFDQIMTDNGLWSVCKWDEIRANLQSGLIQPESELVHDTTHYDAYSSFEVVKYQDDNGKPQKKSQAKVGKSCGCQDKAGCPHEWRLVDEGAGTVVKSSKRIYWAHKASMVGLPEQGIPLDAVAVSDAASFDSQTLAPHLYRLFANLPEIRPWFTHVLDDGAAYDLKLMEEIDRTLHLTLRASMNPRRRPVMTDDLPRGMVKLTPYGELLCMAEHTMDYRGVRWLTESFIYGPPLDEHNHPRCLDCPHRADCCPHAEKGRQATIHFDQLPHIRPDDPPMAKRFKVMMTHRTSIERIIKRMKCDLGDGQLTKRGNAAFQARLDKSMIALHILLRT